MSLKDEFDRYVGFGLVTARRHPKFPLTIYKYSQKCVYEHAWDDYTRTARGLILSDDGEIVARPFRKFFNLGEDESTKKENLPQESPVVMSKVDGSLGVSYIWEGRVYLATMGSFDSEQAMMGTQILSKKSKAEEIILGFHDLTFLFEIIYPENRIVVDYGQITDLVLLGIIDIKSGSEMFPQRVVGVGEAMGFGTPVIYPLNLGGVVEECGRPSKNREGYVLWYPNGLRVKLKYSEYVQLHRVVTGYSEKSVWELLSIGSDPMESLGAGPYPPEFLEFVRTTRDKLNSKFAAAADRVHKCFNEIGNTETRKEFAAKALKISGEDSCLRSALFCLYDKRDISDIIWKSLEPDSSKSVFQQRGEG